jgi:hypothetical protein
MKLIELAESVAFVSTVANLGVASRLWGISFLTRTESILYSWHTVSLYRMIKKSLCTWRTIPTQLMSWRWPSQNTFGMRTVLFWTRSSRTQFGVSINVWRLAGDTLNITCNFLFCNHEVHRDYLITLYYKRTTIVYNFVYLSKKMWINDKHSLNNINTLYFTIF